MAVTIKDVALKAGVSPSTVSRVLSNNPSISENTRKRVRKAMAELHYYPNLTARSLVSKESKVVGIVLPKSSDAFYQNPFFPTTLRGINEVAAESGFSLLLNTGQTDEARLNHIYQMVNGRQVDGLIFMYASENDPILDFVRESKFPYVIIGQTDSWETNFVDNNNEAITKQGTLHFLKQGIRNIAFIGAEGKQRFVQARFQGYQKALEAYDIQVNPEWIFNSGHFLPKTGHHYAEIISKIPDIEAVIIVDQLIARGFKDAVKFMGLNIPYLTFKAFKSHSLPSNTNPYLNINAQELGQRAFKILYDVLSEDNKEQTRFYHEVVNAELITGGTETP